LLAQSVVQDFKGRAHFVAENFSDSQLAKRFGVALYPAIFVDDVLVATPKDFYNFDEKASGRYIPFVKNAESQQRFRADLTRMIELILAGRTDAARAAAAPGKPELAAALPGIAITDLAGHRLAREDLAGRPVLVEMWATWCPPCRGTLAWLGELKKRHGDRLAVVALAVQSEEPAVRKLATELGLPLTWAMGTPELLRAFGDVTSVPTLFLFDRRGKSAGAFYGAPPTLHAEVERRLASLLAAERAGWR
jgi:thiol-disulfide isomerase/thioredoxin